jgi:hypothetical protein
MVTEGQRPGSVLEAVATPPFAANATLVLDAALIVKLKLTVQLPLMAPVVQVLPFQLPCGQVPPTAVSRVYPALAVTTNAVVEPAPTDCAVAGLTVPPVPAEGATE